MGANFRGKSKRPSKLIFVVLNFMTVTSPGAWHCCTSNDVFHIHVLAIFFVTKPYLQRLGQIT